MSVTYDGGLRRPLKLTATEAMTLAVALRTLTELPGATEGGAAERALAKIETAAGQHLDTTAVDIRLATQDRWLALAQRAVEEQRAVELRYYTAARDESTHRVVDPVRVFYADGMAYLEAWCRRAEGMRVFRLDRFEDAQLLDEPARPPADLSPADLKPADLAGGVYRPAPEHLLVELRLGVGWEWVSDYYPCETVTPATDGQREYGFAGEPASGGSGMGDSPRAPIRRCGGGVGARLAGAGLRGVGGDRVDRVPNSVSSGAMQVWLVAGAWLFAVLFALVVLGFAGYELAWKARRLNADRAKLNRTMTELTQLTGQLQAMADRAAGLRPAAGRSADAGGGSSADARGGSSASPGGTVAPERATG